MNISESSVVYHIMLFNFLKFIIMIISRIENKMKQKGKVIYPYFFIFVCKNIEDRVCFPHSVPPYSF